MRYIMKKTFLSMAIIAVGLLIGLSACNKGDNPWGPGDDHDMMVSQTLPDEFMPYFDAEEFTIEGDLNANDIEVYPEFNGRDRNDHGDRDRGHDRDKWREKMKKRHGHGFELRVLLRKLNLDEDQRAEFRKILISYRDCVHNIMKENVEERMEIMQRAREARMDIIKKLRAGEIDREEAIKELRALYTKVKEAMNNLIDKDALCNCYVRMLRQLYSILTPEQQRVFKEWLKNSKNPCLDGFKMDD